MLAIKKRLMITAISAAVSCSSIAATCPAAEGLNPNYPPAGWTLMVPPIFEGQPYVFGKAVHSNNGSFYYQQVICVYQTCPSFGCPGFSLLSTQTYTYPNTPAPPWNSRPTLQFTFDCTPPDHDPAVCVFE